MLFACSQGGARLLVLLCRCWGGLTLGMLDDVAGLGGVGLGGVGMCGGFSGVEV